MCTLTRMVVMYDGKGESGREGPSPRTNLGKWGLGATVLYYHTRSVGFSYEQIFCMRRSARRDKREKKKSPFERHV